MSPRDALFRLPYRIADPPMGLDEWPEPSPGEGQAGIHQDRAAGRNQGGDDLPNEPARLTGVHRTHPKLNGPSEIAAGEWLPLHHRRGGDVQREGRAGIRMQRVGFFDHDGHLGRPALRQAHIDETSVGRLLYGGGERRVETHHDWHGARFAICSGVSLSFPRGFPLMACLALAILREGSV